MTRWAKPARLHFLGPISAPITHCLLKRPASARFMTDQLQTDKSIFLSAIAIGSATERAAYLDNACAGNQALRAEVEALVQAHEKPQRLLDAPPQARQPTIDEPIAERPGTVIGPYKLLQQIGEGGMGVVWMAEQTQP